MKSYTLRTNTFTLNFNFTLSGLSTGMAPKLSSLVLLFEKLRGSARAPALRSLSWLLANILSRARQQAGGSGPGGGGGGGGVGVGGSGAAAPSASVSGAWDLTGPRSKGGMGANLVRLETGGEVSVGGLVVGWMEGHVIPLLDAPDPVVCYAAVQGCLSVLRASAGSPAVACYQVQWVRSTITALLRMLLPSTRFQDLAEVCY